MPRRQGRFEDRVRTTRALQLRLAGATYDQIAETLGYRTRDAAYRAAQAALKRAEKEAAADVVELEVARLDRLLLGLWDRASRGNLQAVDRCLKILESRRKLLGLDAPTKAQVTVLTEDVLDSAISDLERQMAALPPVPSHNGDATGH